MKEKESSLPYTSLVPCFYLISVYFSRFLRQQGTTRSVLSSFDRQKETKIIPRLDVQGSMHRNINLIERTNKMRPCISRCDG